MISDTGLFLWATQYLGCELHSRLININKYKGNFAWHFMEISRIRRLYIYTRMWLNFLLPRVTLNRLFHFTLTTCGALERATVTLVVQIKTHIAWATAMEACSAPDEWSTLRPTTVSDWQLTYRAIIILV